MASSLLERLADKFQAIAEAQDRIREGTYGLCRECGCRIPPPRLEAIPTAIWCPLPGATGDNPFRVLRADGCHRIRDHCNPVPWRLWEMA